MICHAQHASQLVEGLAFHSVTERVAHLILELSAGKVGKPIARDLTLEEMGAAVGTTREVISRTLYQLAEQGLIQVTRTEFIVADEGGLESIAASKR